MPRGGRSRGRSMSPVRLAPRTVARAPAPVQQRSPVPVQQQPTAMAPAGAAPKQPGLLGQMAATAGGVAIGSAVGHTIGHAMTGDSGGSEAQPAAPQEQPQYGQQQPYGQQQQPAEGGTCAYELQQFLNCANNQADISLCTGFNTVLKECKASHGIQ